jgi:hypothetical protein
MRPGQPDAAARASSGEPIARATASGTIRLISLVRTSPGPTSRNEVVPASASARTEDSHLTVEITCRFTSDRSSAGSDTSAPTPFSATGNRGAEKSIASIRSSIAARAGSISGEWNAQSDRADLPFLRERLGPLDRGDRAGDHRLRRRILVRDDEHVVVTSVVAERRCVLGAHAEERRHRAGAFLAGTLHRGAAHDHEVECVAERHDTGRHQRGELAE